MNGIIQNWVLVNHKLTQTIAIMESIVYTIYSQLAEIIFSEATFLNSTKCLFSRHHWKILPLTISGSSVIGICMEKAYFWCGWIRAMPIHFCSSFSSSGIYSSFSIVSFWEDVFCRGRINTDGSAFLNMQTRSLTRVGACFWSFIWILLCIQYTVFCFLITFAVPLVGGGRLKLVCSCCFFGVRSLKWMSFKFCFCCRIWD